ncbi:MAG: DUF4097 family beta strand repeat-containing protein [bacterium]
MKYLIYTCVVLALMTLNTLKADNIKNNGSTKSFQIKKGGTVEFDLLQGNITIETWNKEEVLIRIENEDEEYENPLIFKQSGNNLYVTINKEYEWNPSCDLRVSVPKQINLSIKSNFGDIRLRDDISGTVDLKTSGGEIIFAGINGDLKAFTAGGDLRGADVTGKLDLKTMGGDITTGVLSGNYVKIETMGGDIRIKKSDKGVYVMTHGGDIRIGDIGNDSELITYGGDIVSGLINGNAKLKTLGGDITLNGAKGKVDVETRGGDIKLFNIIGSLNAKTSAGEMYIELTPKGEDSFIKSGYGNVDLYLPSNVKANLDIKIRDAGWEGEESNQLYINFETSAGKKYTKSSNLYGNYTINGGGEKIYVETANSDISIKKNKKTN